MQEPTRLERIRQEIERRKSANAPEPTNDGIAQQTAVAEPMAMQDQYVIPNTESIGGILSPTPVDLGYEAPRPQPTRDSFDVPEMSTLGKIRKRINEIGVRTDEIPKEKDFLNGMGRAPKMGEIYQDWKGDFYRLETGKAKKDTKLSDEDLKKENSQADWAGLKAERQQVYDDAKELLSSTNDRLRFLKRLRTLSPEKRQEVLNIAGKVARNEESFKGRGVLDRLGQAFGTGVADFSQSVMEMTSMGGTPEEIEFARQIGAQVSGKLSAKGDDPSWIESGMYGAAEMAPAAAMMAASGGVGGFLGKSAAGAAGLGVKGTAYATSAGTTSAITASQFPMSYRSEKEQLIEAGVDPEQAWKVAAFSSLMIGAIESIVPNPFPVGKVAGQTVLARFKKRIFEFSKKYPQEALEEYLQGAWSGAVKGAYDDGEFSVSGKIGEEALQQMYQQGDEALLPLAFMMGGGGAFKTAGEIAAPAAGAAAGATAKAGKKIDKRLKENANAPDWVSSASAYRKKFNIPDGSPVPSRKDRKKKYRDIITKADLIRETITNEQGQKDFSKQAISDETAQRNFVPEPTPAEMEAKTNAAEYLRNQSPFAAEQAPANAEQQTAEEYAEWLNNSIKEAQEFDPNPRPEDFIDNVARPARRKSQKQVPQDGQTQTEMFGEKQQPATGSELSKIQETAHKQQMQAVTKNVPVVQPTIVEDGKKQNVPVVDPEISDEPALAKGMTRLYHGSWEPGRTTGKGVL